MRGNVDTRLRKLASGETDAILLAAAGLARLGIAPPGLVALDPSVFLPAIGQGILALEARADDARVRAVLAALDDPATAAAARAERAFLTAIGCDCHTPLAAHAVVHDGRLRMEALVASVDGGELLGDTFDGPVETATAIGARLADALLSRGAARLIAQAAAATSDRP